jgi:hypothetical protein
MSRARPGAALTDAEMLAALIGGAISDLEMFAAPSPNDVLEEVVAKLRFVKRKLIDQIPEGIDHGQEMAE